MLYGMYVKVLLLNFFQWLDQICARVSDLGAFADKRANHVLVNEYQPGQGIMVSVASNRINYFLYYGTRIFASHSTKLFLFYTHLFCINEKERALTSTSIKLITFDLCF